MDAATTIEWTGFLEGVGVDHGEVLGGDAVLGEDGEPRVEGIVVGRVGRGAQGGAQAGGPAALLGAQPDVAARHREAVGLADGGQDLDP